MPAPSLAVRVGVSDSWQAVESILTVRSPGDAVQVVASGDGVMVRAAGLDAPRTVSWDQLRRFVQSGELLDGYYGVVSDGELLLPLFNSRSEADDKACDLRAVGEAVSVVRVPARVKD